MQSCCVCGFYGSSTLARFSLANLEPSTLYKDVRVVSCDFCGHVYNPIDKDREDGIIKFYEDEYSVDSLASPGSGDMPGGSNASSLYRYNLLYDVLSGFSSVGDSVLDVGCAAGGYLSFLRSKGYSSLFGVDLCPAYVVEALKKDGIIIKQGSADNLPLDGQFDVIVSNQVVEHLFDPNKFFSGARRLLKPGGIFCVNVPDAFSYAECSFFERFWLLIREHVQHFDEAHLRHLGESNGFDCLKVSRFTTPMLSDKAPLPNLTLVFKKNDVVSKNVFADFGLKRYLSAYGNEVVPERVKLIDYFSKSKLPFYVWGMSREFSYLYENSNLHNCNVLGYLDDTPSKQGRSINGHVVQSSEVLSNPNNSKGKYVLITAFAHQDKLGKKANEWGHFWIKV